MLNRLFRVSDVRALSSKESWTRPLERQDRPGFCPIQCVTLSIGHAAPLWAVSAERGNSLKGLKSWVHLLSMCTADFNVSTATASVGKGVASEKHLGDIHDTG